jgi:3-phosphoinositide dependent protein kinase-1
MSTKGIYHRDLKPENILMDERMHMKICDFSTAVIEGMKFDKRIMKFVKADEFKPSGVSGGGEDSEREDEEVYDVTKEFVGTPEYISPEVLSRNYDEISRSVDLWALGCIIYRCLHGQTPFKDKNNQVMFDKIINVDYKLDESLDENAKDIIKKLLVRDPQMRLGAGSQNSDNDFVALKSHPFFTNINWDILPSTEAPIEVSDLTLSMAGFKIFEDHDSLTPIRRGSKIEKKLNSFTETPQFIYNINVVDKTEEAKKEKEEVIFECNQICF